MTTKTKFLATRLTPEDHRVFQRKAHRYGKPSDILRELIQAFIQERLIIKPPVTSKKEGLYHE